MRSAVHVCLALLASASALTPKSPPAASARVTPRARAVPAAWSPAPVGAAAMALVGSPLSAMATDGEVGSWLQSKEVHELGIFLAQTVISWGVPAVVAGALAITIASAGKGGGGADEPPPLPPALAKALGVSAEPKEYLQIEKLNSKLESYEYSFRKASISKSSALRIRGKQEIERQFGLEFEAFGLDAATCEKVLKAAKAYRRAEERVAKQIEVARIELRAAGLSAAGGAAASVDEEDADAESASPGAAAEEAGSASGGGGGGLATLLPKANPLASMGQGMKTKGMLERITKLESERLTLELDFLKRLSAILTADQAAALAAVLKPSSAVLGGEGGAARGGKGASARGGPMGAMDAADNDANIPRLGGRLDALSALVTAAAEAAGKSKHVYVIKFFGDVTASQVAQLRQEVTAVLRSADVDGRGDEVVLVLNTGGGTVTGYGLAAAQLLRLKEAGLHLTICVEQVAASGGYMMACVADKLVAAPFAVLGSIGVITEQPNVYERLKREGVQFSTITAGKYKRTLTPTKKIDPLDEKKLKTDIEQVLTLFKGFVATNRPQLDIEKVATGETWFGPDAMERNMVDELKTVDDVLLRYVDDGAQVFGVRYAEKPPSPLAALGVGGSAGAGLGGGAGATLQGLARGWLANKLLGVGAGGAGVRAAELAELEGLLRLQQQQSPQGGVGGAALMRPDEPEMLAAMPADAAQPRLEWRSEEGGATPGTDSWFL